jgi:hypothetical protein
MVDAARIGRREDRARRRRRRGARTHGLPLVAAGLLLAGGAAGAVGALVGALAREARTASLVAVLVVLPVVFLGMVPARSSRLRAG